MKESWKIIGICDSSLRSQVETFKLSRDRSIKLSGIIWCLKRTILFIWVTVIIILDRAMCVLDLSNVNYGMWNRTKFGCIKINGHNCILNKFFWIQCFIWKTLYGELMSEANGKKKSAHLFMCSSKNVRNGRCPWESLHNVIRHTKHTLFINKKNPG